MLRSRRPGKSSSKYLMRRLFIMAVLVVMLIMLFQKRDKPEVKPPPSQPPGVAVNQWFHLAYRMDYDPYHPENLWVVGEQGIRVRLGEDVLWKVYGKQPGLPSQRVTSLIFDKNEIWFGTGAGLVRFDRKEEVFHPLGKNTPGLRSMILSLYRDREAIWMGTYENGLLKWIPGEDSVLSISTSEGISSNRIHCMEQVFGVFYLGHEDGTVSYGNPEEGWRMLEFPEAYSAHSQNEIWDMEISGSTLWIATAAAGIWEYDFAKKSWNQHLGQNGFQAKGAYDLAIYGNDLLAGSHIGIFRYNIPAKAWIHFISDPDKAQHRVTALTGTLSGTVNKQFWYAAAGDGVYECNMNVTGCRFESPGFSHEGVEAMVASNKGLWYGFGFKGGYLNWMSKDFLHSPPYTLWQGQPLQHIQVFARDENLIMAGALEGFGYTDLNEDSAWTIITSSQKEKIRDVTSFTRSDDEFFLGTGTGIFEFNPTKGSAIKRQDLIDDYISFLGSVNRHLLVGTLRNGIVVYQKQGEKYLKLGHLGKNIAGFPRCLMQLNQHTVWFGMGQDGIWELSLEQDGMNLESFTKVSHQPFPQAKIKVMRMIDNSVWIGTEENGISIYQVDSASWKGLNTGHALPSNDIRSIEDAYGYIWIGDALGVTRIHSDSLKKLF